MINAFVSALDAIFRLGYQTYSDAQASGAYATDAELFQFADDAAKLLAYRVGVLMSLDSSVTITAGVSVYNLQGNHVFTVYAWVAPLPNVGGSVQLLRATPVNNLFALDDTWASSSGEATRYSLDAGSVGTITLYPTPVNSGILNQICQEYPATVSYSNLFIDLPYVLQDYLTYSILAAARGKESDQAMPEMAAHFKERTKLYEQVCESLYGPGQ